MVQCIGFVLSFILFMIFSLDVHSQTPGKNYEEEWKKVEELMKKNLPKSAAIEVKNISTGKKR